MITIKKAKIVKLKKGEIAPVDNNIHFHDIEVFPNYFLTVLKNRDTKDYTIVEIHDKDNGDLKKTLDESSGLIGYNCLSYDGQVIEFIIKNPGCSVHDIKKFSDSLINSKNRFPPFRAENLSYNYLDIMEINNYGIHSAKSTSLKHLSVFFRSKSVADSPCDFNQEVTDKDKIDIIKYCLKDTDDTEKIYNASKSLIDLRIKFGQEEDLNVINDSEVRLAKKYICKVISDIGNIPIDEVKNARTFRDKVEGKNLILPYINFKTEDFNKIKDFYEKISLKPSLKSFTNPNKQCISLKKSIEYICTIRDTEYDYKGGGLHGCYKRGIYSSDEKYIIRDLDYTSFYPMLAIINKFAPLHVPIEVYVQALQTLFDKRVKFNKKDHFAMNYAFKIILNLLYGQSNTEYGPLYDAEYTLKTCVNGMLTISMLIESIFSIDEDIIVLQANTDGITIRYPREFEDKIQEKIKENEKITGLSIEQVVYKQMIIYDVNNYLSLDEYGNYKQKGLFQTRDNMIKEGAYHKDPSNNIVAVALNKYFEDGTKPEDTINDCNDIFEFISSAKGSKTFKWLINSTQPSGVITSTLATDRVVRYYVGGNSSISKMWLKDKTTEGESLPSGFTLLNASQPVTLCQTINNNEIIVQKKGIGAVSNFPNLNKQYYIDECNKIINNLIT